MNYTECTAEGCTNTKQKKEYLYCSRCDIKHQDTLVFEDFDNPDDYYFHIFNGDADAVECHKRLLGEWYGMAPRDISNAFAEQVGLGTAADHSRRVMADKKAHSPADICSLDRCPVIINGLRYKSILSWATATRETETQAYSSANTIRRLLFENGGDYTCSFRARNMTDIHSVRLIIDEDKPWSDRYQAFQRFI